MSKLDSNPTKPFINDHIHSRLHNIATIAVTLHL